jgi:tight adherence protein B
VTHATWWLGRIACVLLSFALLVGSVALVVGVDSQGQRQIRSYLATLDRQLRFIRSAVRGVQILVGQFAVGLGIAGLAVWLREWVWLVPLPAILVGPKVFLNKYSARRIATIEEQIEFWINAVANALKASPSLGDAICSTTTLVPSPMCQELDVLVKEYELGTPLDQALENLGVRVNSRTLSGTVTALKIARQSGGNLAEMLETAAASLREFARLEGVVRTKTAEGKAQAFVIGMIPIPMVLGIEAMDPHFFQPLFHSFAGQLIVAVAAALWAVAIVAARKILAVDV